MMQIIRHMQNATFEPGFSETADLVCPGYNSGSKVSTTLTTNPVDLIAEWVEWRLETEDASMNPARDKFFVVFCSVRI